jgi:DNA gyrase/topoisomerase IV subunit B
MYIGNPDSSGKLTCFREILNNSVDEFLSNNASIITVTRLSDDEFAIADNGRGVPFDKHKSGKNALEVIFGELHAGRNFSEKTVYSTGINGVGASCVNALSEVFQVTSQRSNDVAHITFNDGIKTNLELKKDNSKLAKNKTGTIVHWRFNNKFFEENSVIDEKELKQLLEETALLNDGLKINFINYFNENGHQNA